MYASMPAAVFRQMGNEFADVVEVLQAVFAGNALFDVRVSVTRATTETIQR